MKDRIIAALALLAGVTSDVRPGGQGEIQFKQALVELQGAIDEPAPAPEKIIQTEVATEALADLVAARLGEKLDGMIEKLDGLEDHMAAFMEVHADTPETEPAPAAA